VGGQLIVFGGIPFNLCLGISSADVGDNSLGDIRYATGRHTAPIFAGDTVFASTEIRGVSDFPGRPDLGVLSATLRGHKFVKKDDVERVEIFYLEREIAVKRRGHYTTRPPRSCARSDCCSHSPAPRSPSAARRSSPAAAARGAARRRRS